MNIDEACVSCIINQSARVADAITEDKLLKEKIVTTVEQMSKNFSFSKNPPEIAADVYEKMADLANKYDLYDTAKRSATRKALALKPRLEERLNKASDKLYTATKIAVAGNVIDLAAQVAFDIDEELEKIFETEFAYNDFAKLQQKLERAERVVVIGDNVGEHIFDYIFIETLQKIYKDRQFFYMVRGNPIINDVTMQEAKEQGFDKLCELVDSGVNTPGFVYERATAEAKEIFESADLVISKGMGNYECLTPQRRENICFLLKVKCSVVANSLSKEIGDIICKLA